MAGWLSIINASDEDFDKLTGAIDNCDGSAESMAEIMQDTLTHRGCKPARSWHDFDDL